MVLQVIAQIALVALVGCLIWVFCKPDYEFVVRIHDGKPVVQRGTVSHRFLHDLQELCRREGVATGSIRGVRKGNRVSLKFAGVPPELHQAVRNAWSFER